MFKSCDFAISSRRRNQTCLFRLVDDLRVSVLVACADQRKMAKKPDVAFLVQGWLRCFLKDWVKRLEITWFEIEN